MTLFEVFGQIPGNRRTDRYRPCDRSARQVLGAYVVPQRFDFDQTIFPSLVLLDAMHGGRNPGEDGGVFGPGDGGDFADYAIRPATFAHEPAQIGNLELELVAVAEITLVEAIDRQQQEPLPCVQG